MSDGPPPHGATDHGQSCTFKGLKRPSFVAPGLDVRKGAEPP